MGKILITLVVGARPNFMKIAPIIRALDTHNKYFSYRLVHTGQHQDNNMSDVFFTELGIPSPNLFLNSNANTPLKQIAKIMIDFEDECLAYPPSIVLVVGDVNSTLACSIVAKKLNIKLVHVEAGLRSNDREMPEEINRVSTDAISDLFFVTEPSGILNLLNEGHSNEKVHYVGNVMIDNLLYQKEKLDSMAWPDFPSCKLKNELNNYAVVTLHRPSNVDSIDIFSGIAESLNEIANSLPIIFPVHPRTRKNIKKFKIMFNENIFLIDPLSYLEFLNLWKDSQVVLTDSGGLQEETSALGIRCITIRNNTERPITVEKGTNVLAGVDSKNILDAFSKININENPKTNQIELWDGLSAKRIIAILTKEFNLV
jgi:UDP-N-acetylglucosamine 2-epimerase (non-hydrolysing)